MTDKPIPKESLQVELKGFLAAAHGDIKNAAGRIADALDRLIQDKNKQNKDMFIAAVKEAMALPKAVHFKSVDPEVRKALLEILEHAQLFIQSGLSDLIALNEKIKQEKKKLKDRIDQVEIEKRQFRR